MTVPDEVVVRRALGGEVLWQRAPLTACRQDVENSIEHFPDIDMPFAPSVPRGRNEGLHQTPFVIKPENLLVMLGDEVQDGLVESLWLLPIDRMS